MFVFYFQLTVTFLLIFLYLRLKEHFSLSHKWLTGLEFCIPPGEKELNKLDSNTSVLKRRKSRTTNEGKMHRIELTIATIDDRSLFKHLFWEDYDLLVLALLTVSMNFILSEFWSCFLKQESNSLVNLMLILGVFISLKALVSVMTRVPLQIVEWKLIFFITILSWIFCYLLLSLPDSILDFSADLKEGYYETVDRLNRLLAQYEQQHRINLSYGVFKLILCSFASFLSGIVILPGFRLARSYQEMKLYTCDRHDPMISSLSFVLPIFAVLLWINPIARDLIDFQSSNDAELFDRFFELFRVSLVVLICMLRFYLFRPYVRSFLASAIGWTELMLHDHQFKERGKEIKSKMLYLYTFICIVSVQLIAPTLLLLCFVLLFKSLSLESNSNICTLVLSSLFNFLYTAWLSLSSLFTSAIGASTNTNAKTSATASISTKLTQKACSIPMQRDERTFSSISNGIHSLDDSLFACSFHRGLFGFLVWWLLLSLFSFTLFALVYERNQAFFSKRIEKTNKV